MIFLTRILHGQAGVLGDYKELAILPDKIASYLYEYDADSYPCLSYQWTEVM